MYHYILIYKGPYDFEPQQYISYGFETYGECKQALKYHKSCFKDGDTKIIKSRVEKRKGILC